MSKSGLPFPKCSHILGRGEIAVPLTDEAWGKHVVSSGPQRRCQNFSMLVLGSSSLLRAIRTNFIASSLLVGYDVARIQSSADLIISSMAGFQTVTSLNEPMPLVKLVMMRRSNHHCNLLRPDSVLASVLTSSAKSFVMADHR